MTERRRPRADARRNRERVLEAAEAVFGRDGPSASTGDVAQAAEVGIGTVFRHFPTKEALVEAVVVARIDRLRRQAEGLADAGDPGPAFFDFFATVVEGSHTKLALVDALDRPDLPAVLAASPAGQGLVEALDRLLRRAQAAGAVRGDVLVTDVMALFIACSRAVQQVPGDDRASRRILAVVRDGLRPPPSGPDQLRVPR